MVTGLSAKQALVGSIPTDRSERMLHRVVRSLQNFACRVRAPEHARGRQVSTMLGRDRSACKLADQLL